METEHSSLEKNVTTETVETVTAVTLPVYWKSVSVVMASCKVCLESSVSLRSMTLLFPTAVVCAASSPLFVVMEQQMPVKSVMKEYKTPYPQMQYVAQIAALVDVVMA